MGILTIWLSMADLALSQNSLAPTPMVRPAIENPDRSVRIQPDWAAGMEWLYRGQITENFQSGQAEYARAYRLEARALALGNRQGNRTVAILTQLREKDAGRKNSGDQTATTILNVCTVNELGRLQEQEQSNQALPSGGLMVERGMFLEVPPGGIALGDVWETSEPGQPPTRWSAVGRETVQGVPSLKIEGEQMTPEWRLPRADRTAWHRTEIVWLGLRNGVATRVERTIERREPAREATSQKCVVRYDLDSSIQYPASLLAERVRDIDQVWNLTRASIPLIRSGGTPEAFNIVCRKVDLLMDSSPATPYRSAVMQVKRSLESARKGELPPPVLTNIGFTTPAQPNSVAGSLAVGRPAPDFVAPFIYGGQGSATLKIWKDQPLLLAFIQPGTPVAEQVVIACKNWKQKAGDRLTVLLLPVKPESRPLERLVRDTSFKPQVLDGSGLRISYAVESTPRLVLMDSRHKCLGIYDGWGTEAQTECDQEIDRLLMSIPNR